MRFEIRCAAKALEFLYPPHARCAGCGNLLGADEWLCEDCRAELWRELRAALSAASKAYLEKGGAAGAEEGDGAEAEEGGEEGEPRTQGEQHDSTAAAASEGAGSGTKVEAAAAGGKDGGKGEQDRQPKDDAWDKLGK